MVGENNVSEDLGKAGKGEAGGKVGEVTGVKVVLGGQENGQKDGRKAIERTNESQKGSDGNAEKGKLGVEDALGDNEEEEEEDEEEDEEEEVDDVVEAKEEVKETEEEKEDRCRCDRVPPGEEYDIPKEELEKAATG